MKNFSKMGVLCLEVLLALAMTGCTLPISANLREEANRNLNFAQVADNPAAYVGNTVIWEESSKRYEGPRMGRKFRSCRRH